MRRWLLEIYTVPQQRCSFKPNVQCGTTALYTTLQHRTRNSGGGIIMREIAGIGLEAGSCYADHRPLVRAVWGLSSESCSLSGLPCWDVPDYRADKQSVTRYNATGAIPQSADAVRIKLLAGYERRAKSPVGTIWI